MFNTPRRLLVTALAAGVCAGFTAGCGGGVDVDKAPIGSPVELTRQDGGVITGKLIARDPQSVHVVAGASTRVIPRAEIAGLEVMDGTTPPRLPAAAKFREYTVPEGTVLAARLNTSVGSGTSRVNDPVRAELTRAVVIDGVDVLPQGSIITGAVTSAIPSGDVNGRASLAVRFNAIAVDGRDDPYELSAGFQHTAAGTKKRDIKTIGIPAVGGAILGGILGGKKGALIGATVGGGAGAVVVLTTSGPEVRYSQGTVVSLPLRQPIDVRVSIRK